MAQTRDDKLRRSGLCSAWERQLFDLRAKTACTQAAAETRTSPGRGCSIQAGFDSDVPARLNETIPRASQFPMPPVKTGVILLLKIDHPGGVAAYRIWSNSVFSCAMCTPIQTPLTARTRVLRHDETHVISIIGKPEDIGTAAVWQFYLARFHRINRQNLIAAVLIVVDDLIYTIKPAGS